jgi:phage-related protein
VAVLGEAFVIVRPITAGFEGAVARDLKRLDGTARTAGRRAGKVYAGAFGQAFGPSGAGKYTNEQLKKAVSAQKAYASLSRAGYVLQTSLGVLGGSIGALVGGLVSLGSALLAAAPSAIALGGALVYVGIGAAVAKLALGGVGKAVAALNKQQTKAATDDTAAKRRVEDATRNLARVQADNIEALARASKNLEDSQKDLTTAQKDLNRALKEGAEELQQINFDAEDAALAEQRAANELEDARKTLARVQDLPPNSRARREAELAYKEADLNLRRAKDRNSDLRKEQDRLAKEGVEGLDSVIDARQKVADAEVGVQEAVKDSNKAVLDAAEREEDADRELARAKQDLAKKDDGGGADPLAGLTESQKKFALFISSLKPQIDELKEAAAGAFLPKLQEAIAKIFGPVPFATIKLGIEQVAGALGDASLSIANSIVDAGNLEDLGKVFENAATGIRKIGEFAGNLWGVFLGVLVAADPLIQKFLDWLVKITGKWEAWLDEDANKQKLTDFFNEAGRVAGEIGTIIGNIASGLGNIIKANTGPGTGGQMLLDYFRDITGAFEAFSGSGTGQAALKDYFAGTATNTMSILDSVGAFVKELLKLGADPNVKGFWDAIGKAAPDFGKILKAGLETGPIFGELVANIIGIIAALADSSGPKIFFEILNKVAEVMKKILENEFVQFLLKISGYIHGVTLALGLMWTGWKTFQLILLGTRIITYNTVAKMFGMLKTAIGGVITAMKFLKVAFATNPFGMILLAITLLVGAFILLYNKNETFRNFVQEAWAKIKEIIGGVVDFLVNLFSTMWDGIKAGLEAVWGAIKFVWDAIVAGVKLYIDTLIAVYSFVWDVLKTGLEAVWEGIKFVWEIIKTGVKLYIDALVTVIKFVWDVLKTGLELIWAGIKLVWDIIVAGVKIYIGLVTGAIKFVWDVLKTGLDIVWGKIKGVWDTIIAFIGGIGGKIKNAASGMWDGLKSGLQGVINTIISGINFIIRAINKIKIPSIGIGPLRTPAIGFNLSEISPVQLAAGGIVMPSSGGTVATIAEAGRPERVEPLDPDGLSKRDKAMINLLTKGGTAGATFNVYPSAGMDEVELAALISRQIAFQTRRGAA